MLFPRAGFQIITERGSLEDSPCLGSVTSYLLDGFKMDHPCNKSSDKKNYYFLRIQLTDFVLAVASEIPLSKDRAYVKDSPSFRMLCWIL